jgi:hypothetical protein
MVVQEATHGNSVQIPHIIASANVETYIRSHGGSIFIWPSHHRCCGGRLTLLDTSFQPPRQREFEAIASRGFTVFLDASLRERPERIDLSLRGIRRKRIEAYWDGCAFILLDAW